MDSFEGICLNPEMPWLVRRFKSFQELVFAYGEKADMMAQRLFAAEFGPPRLPGNLAQLKSLMAVSGDDSVINIRTRTCSFDSLLERAILRNKRGFLTADDKEDVLAYQNFQIVLSGFMAGQYMVSDFPKQRVTVLDLKMLDEHLPAVQSVSNELTGRPLDAKAAEERLRNHQLGRAVLDEYQAAVSLGPVRDLPPLRPGTWLASADEHPPMLRQ